MDKKDILPVYKEATDTTPKLMTSLCEMLQLYNGKLGHNYNIEISRGCTVLWKSDIGKDSNIHWSCKRQRCNIAGQRLFMRNKLVLEDKGSSDNPMLENKMQVKIVVTTFLQERRQRAVKVAQLTLVMDVENITEKLLLKGPYSQRQDVIYQLN